MFTTIHLVLFLHKKISVSTLVRICRTAVKPSIIVSARMKTVYASSNIFVNECRLYNKANLAPKTRSKCIE